MTRRKEQPMNLVSSVKDRIFAIARQNNLEFNYLLRQYFQERFLYRVSVSGYNRNFILKGALLFSAYEINPFRPTRDIDFLGTQIKNNLKEIEYAFRQISGIIYNDGAIYYADKIESEIIIEGADYKGIRVHIPCSLGTVREKIHIDIGFGDIVFPEPSRIDFPVLLDFDPPSLMVYSIESSIAEKFQTIVKLGITSSRMKDYYDIFFLCTNRTFDFPYLKRAITETFNHRGTSTTGIDLIFSQGFKNREDFRKLWTAFIRKRSLEQDLEFSNVVNVIEKFLAPVIDHTENYSNWNQTKLRWEKTIEKP